MFPPGGADAPPGEFSETARVSAPLDAPIPDGAKPARGFGLTSRLALLTAVLAVALVLGATELTLRWSEGSRLDDARREALTVANTLASYLTSATPREHRDELIAAFASWAQQDVSGTDAVLYVASGTTLSIASAVDSSLLLPPDALDRTAFRADSTVLAWVTSPYPAWRVAAPIGRHRPYGVLDVTLSAQRLETQALEERRRAYPLALGAALLVAVGVYGVTARWVGRPLDAIGRAMAAAHEGAGGSPHAPAIGPGEFRALAERYNDLLDALARRERESEGRAALLALEERARGLDRLAVSAATAGEFAHEIGTPLSTMRGHLQLLRDDVALAGERRAVERVDLLLEHVDRVTRIVRAGLEEHAWPAPRMEPVDVYALATRLVRFLEPSLDQARVHARVVRAAPQESLPAAHTDAAMAEQILLNLLKNAIEALPAGGHVVVEVGGHDGHVDVDVSDDGPGLPAGVRADPFRPFATTKASGTGLGLAVSHRLARALGGELTALAVPAGTRWRLTLPVVETVA